MVTKEQIQEANAKDILKIAESLGLPITKVGSGYRSGKNLAYQFNPHTNTYSNYRTGVKGADVIALFQNETGLDFEKAVEQLCHTDVNLVEINHTPQPKEPFRWYFKTSPNADRATELLVNQRKLPEKLVKLLVDKRYIIQDKYQQIVFPWYKNGQVVGADVKGTVYRPDEEHPYFKGIAKNSENFGYNIKVGSGTVKDIYIFEAPVDLLSYWALHPEIKDCLLFSVSGTSNANRVELAMNYAQATYGMSQEPKEMERSIHICVDNDEQGSKFWKKFDKQNDLVLEWNGDCVLFEDDRPDPAFGKDWNDVLIYHAKEYEQTLSEVTTNEEMVMG